jgi:hypothetical protein
MLFKNAGYKVNKSASRYRKVLSMCLEKKLKGERVLLDEKEFCKERFVLKIVQNEEG